MLPLIVVSLIRIGSTAKQLVIELLLSSLALPSSSALCFCKMPPLFLALVAISPPPLAPRPFLQDTLAPFMHVSCVKVHKISTQPRKRDRRLCGRAWGGPHKRIHRLTLKRTHKRIHKTTCKRTHKRTHNKNAQKNSQKNSQRNSQKNS